MRKYLLINFLFVIFIQVAAAQNVFVSGHLKGYEPESLVRLIVPADLFSKQPRTLATTYAGKNDDFSFHISLKHPVYAYLAVNLKKSSFFLEPGENYQLEIVRDTTGQHGSIFDQQPPEINIVQGNTSLSDSLGNFNEVYNQFLLAHFKDVYLYHNRSVLDNFKKEVTDRFSKDTALYVKNYIRYSMASLEWAARTMSPDAFAKKYFTGQKVLYNNVQYVEQFRSFFKSFFESILHDPLNMSHLSVIMPTGNFHKLDALFSKVPLLQADPCVRELAEMVSLEKYFYHNDFDRWSILRMFERMAQQCKYPENRKIAHDFYLKLKQLIPGSKAPDFDLPGFNGKEYTLESFRHKFVLLAFFKTQDPMCENQLSYLKNLSDHEYDDFTPVVILVGKHTDYYLKAYLSQQYAWPFLLLGKDILLLEKYQVMDYPAYVLINPDGTIAMSPAPMPEENALQRISSYIMQYKKTVKN